VTFREGFRLLGPHHPNCWLRESDQPFVLHDGIDWNLNKNGVGRGGWSFDRFRCNDPKCEAVMRVRADVLSAWIGDGLPTPTTAISDRLPDPAPVSRPAVSSPGEEGEWVDCELVDPITLEPLEASPGEETP
jgi:hypothetical protein